MSVAPDRVDQLSGLGTLTSGEKVFERIPYAITRHQGMAQSGLPIPGLHRIEGSIDLAAVPEAAALVGRDCTLRLEDGRGIRLTIADCDGRVLAVGHGPSRCGCC
jgi:hypothetical protein